MLNHWNKKRRTLACIGGTYGGSFFVHMEHRHIFFAYWHYSICVSVNQYVWSRYFMNFFDICHKNVIKFHFLLLYHTVNCPKIKAFPTLSRNNTRFKVIKQGCVFIMFRQVTNVCLRMWMPMCGSISGSFAKYEIKLFLSYHGFLCIFCQWYISFPRIAFCW